MRLLLLIAAFILTGCAVNQVAPPVKHDKINFVKQESFVKHSISVYVEDERKEKMHSKKLRSYLKKVFSAQLNQLGHNITGNSPHNLIINVKDYKIALSGSICTTSAKFRYSYTYGKRMTSNHDIEDSESSVPCFSNDQKYESTEKLMNILVKDFTQWYLKNNKVVKSL